MKKPCPICGKSVKVHDPYAREEIKRASAWFAVHRDWRTNKQCCGSRMTAISREPRPASLEPS